MVLARWWLRDCAVLLLDEPTRGIDVGARQALYRHFRQLARRGKALETAIAKVVGKGIGKKREELGGSHYKRVPRGYGPGHPRAGLLLHNGLHTGTHEPIPKSMFGAGAVGHCCKHYRKFSPLQRWLVANVVEGWGTGWVAGGK